MFWVFALIEEYFFMILFLNTTVAMQRQELSFFYTSIWNIDRNQMHMDFI